VLEGSRATSGHGILAEAPVLATQKPASRSAADQEAALTTIEIRQIGTVQSTLTDFDSAPRQGDEGAPAAWLVFEPDVTDALNGLRAGAGNESRFRPAVVAMGDPKYAAPYG
jgi:hypothetical protein